MTFRFSNQLGGNDSRGDGGAEKDWKPELRIDKYGKMVADLYGRTREREHVEQEGGLPGIYDPFGYLRGRTPARYFKDVACAGGCRSKMQAVAVRLYLRKTARGWVPVNGEGQPLNPDWRQLARAMNRLGYFMQCGKPWNEERPTRLQQVVYEGLAWCVVFDALRTGQLKHESLEDAYERVWEHFKAQQKSVYDDLWDFLRRKRKVKKSGKKPDDTAKRELETFIRYVNGEPIQVVRERKPIDWNAKRRRAKAAKARKMTVEGWEPPDWF